MRRILTALLILAVLLLPGCSSSGEAGEPEAPSALADVSGTYQGTMTFAQVETAEDDSWEGFSTEVAFLVKQEGTQMTLTSQNEDEEDNETFTGDYDPSTGTFSSDAFEEEGFDFILNFREDGGSLSVGGDLTYTDPETNLQDIIRVDMVRQD